MNKIKAIVFNNETLYRYYTYSIINGYKKRLKLASLRKNDTDFFVTGYPRSGNTIFAHILKGVFSDKKIVTHLHCVAAIKIALNYNKKTIVVFRDPKDSITSMLLKATHGKNMHRKWISYIRSKLSINWYLEEYINYYGYVLNNHESLLLINSKNLYQRPEYAVNQVYKYIRRLCKTLTAI